MDRARAPPSTARRLGDHGISWESMGVKVEVQPTGRGMQIKSPYFQRVARPCFAEVATILDGRRAPHRPGSGTEPPQARCQTACKPGSVRAIADARRPFLWDTHCCAPRATNPGDGAGMPLHPAFAAAGRPYSVLLPVGFTLPPPSPGARCALAAPFRPCPQRTPLQAKAVRAVCFLWHCPWGRPRRPLAGTVFPWSPDFPPPPRAPEAWRAVGGSGRPAVWHRAI